MEEGEEELKSFLMKVREESEKADLNFKNVKTVSDFIFLGSQNQRGQ